MSMQVLKSICTTPGDSRSPEYRLQYNLESCVGPNGTLPSTLLDPGLVCY